MKKYLFLFFFTFLSLIVTAQQLPLKREARGAWIATVVNIDWPTPSLNVEGQKKQLLAILDYHAAHGINIVIFQVRSESDAMYPSPYEPWSTWLTGSQGTPPNPLWDPLQFAVEEAHKRGMELHAWFNPYRAERSAGNYVTASNHVTKAHPDWILQVGSIRIVDPGLQQVRDHVTKVICDVVRRYDIDAAHMDDYFYVEGISTQDAATFAGNNPGGLSLGDWRRSNVNKLIKQVYDSIQIIKPWVKWGISPAGIYKNGVPAGTSGNDTYSVLYCDPVAWMSGKYIDYLAPQLYWRIGGNQDFTKLLPWWFSVSNGRHMIPGIAAYRIGDASYGNAGEVGNQIRYYRTNANAAGNFIYTTNNLIDNRGGVSDSLTNSLYISRALVPSMNWKDGIPPNAPQNFRFGRFQNSPIATITWDVPLKASDNDSASMYVVYQPDALAATSTEINDARNIVSISNQRWFNPLNSKKMSKNFFVTALDRNHNESAPSNLVSLSTLPSQPLLASPVNGMQNQKSSVQLLWNYTEAAGIYALQVSTDSNFSSTILTSSLYDTTISVQNLLGEQSYYWRVKATNVVGEGIFSNIQSFRTGFPAAPVLLAPTDLLTNTPFTMQFVWQKNPMSTGYRFQLSKSSDYSVLVKDTVGIGDTTIVQSNLAPFTIYFWRVRFFNSIDTSEWTARKFRTQQAASVATNGLNPEEYYLAQNYPNPFNPTTTISFSLKNGGLTTVKVYDVLGREVAMIVNEVLSAGIHSYSFSADHLAGGVYLYRLVSGELHLSRKMILQK